MSYVSICIIVFLLSLTHSLQIRGVAPKDEAKYSGKEYVCDNGRKVIPISFVNDNFCDCLDGSDEPGTSACSFRHNEASFFCENKGYFPKYIYASQVNDGLCDCCDGSDEDKGICKNTCNELGERFKGGFQGEIEIMRSSLKKRSENIALANKELGEKRVELEELNKQKAEKVPIVDMWRESKNKAEKIEKDEKNALREKKKSEWLEERGLVEEIVEEEIVEEEVDEDLKVIDGEVVTEEIPELVKAPDMDIKEDMAAKRKREREEREKKNKAEREERERKRKEEEEKKQLEREEENRKRKEKREKERLDRDLERYEGMTKEQLLAEAKRLKRDVEEKKKKISEQEEEIKKLQDEIPPPEEFEDDDEIRNYKTEDAEKARAEYNKFNDELEEIKKKIEEVEKTLGFDYGTYNEFYYLKGKCFSKLDKKKYTYEFCPYDKAEQKEESKSSIKLGNWKEFESLDYSKFSFIDGQSCWKGPKRSLTLKLECGLEEEFYKVDEPSMCVYEGFFKTPSACNEKDLKELQERMNILK